VLPLLVAFAGIGQAITVLSGPTFNPDPDAPTISGSGADTDDSNGTNSSCCNGGLLFKGYGETFVLDTPPSVQFSYNGSGIGTLIPGIYATWNFTVYEFQSDPTVSYTLDFKINGVDTTIDGTVLNVDESGENASGQQLLNYTTGDPLTDWSATFTFTGAPAYGLAVDFDPGSITINVPGAVPEPASFLMVAPALGLLAVARRRLKASAGRR